MNNLTDLEKKSSYYEKVWDVTRQIPHGRFTTYGSIADYLHLGSARMVGWALKQIDFMDDSIPAHRVVNSKGELSGRNAFPTPETMQIRLELEGIKVKKWKIQDFNKHYWHPEEMDEG